MTNARLLTLFEAPLGIFKTLAEECFAPSGSAARLVAKLGVNAEHVLTFALTLTPTPALAWPYVGTLR